MIGGYMLKVNKIWLIAFVAIFFGRIIKPMEDPNHQGEHSENRWLCQVNNCTVSDNSIENLCAHLIKEHYQFALYKFLEAKYIVNKEGKAYCSMKKCTKDDLSSENILEHITKKHRDIALHKLLTTGYICAREDVVIEPHDNEYQNLRSIVEGMDLSEYCERSAQAIDQIAENLFLDEQEISSDKDLVLWQCPDCQYGTNYRQLFFEHMKAAHGKATCPKCKIFFDDCTEFSRHLCNHFWDYQKKKYICDRYNCFFDSNRFRHLISHILKVHIEQNLCVARNQVTRFHGPKRKHSDLENKKLTPPQAKIARIGSSTIDKNLDINIDPSKPKLNFIQQMFDFSAESSSHSGKTAVTYERKEFRVLNFIGIWQCIFDQNCHFSTDELRKYYTHAKKHTQYICPKGCEVTFGTYDNFRSHLVKGHYLIIEGESERYKCDAQRCAKIFQSFEALVGHMGSKHFNRKYICKLCKQKRHPKVFESFRNHLRTMHDFHIDKITYNPQENEELEKDIREEPEEATMEASEKPISKDGFQAEPFAPGDGNIIEAPEELDRDDCDEYEISKDGDLEHIWMALMQDGDFWSKS